MCYALSFVKGRVAMEFFELTECHRKSEAGRDIVYPVNAIAFHPVCGTFATCGCDGFVESMGWKQQEEAISVSTAPDKFCCLVIQQRCSILDSYIQLYI
nr:mitotic checkpoint protein BUB3.1 [Tanacetum cinerariifolium]